MTLLAYGAAATMIVFTAAVRTFGSASDPTTEEAYSIRDVIDRKARIKMPVFISSVGSASPGAFANLEIDIEAPISIGTKADKPAIPRSTLARDI